MSYKGCLRTFYKHDGSARAGEGWAERKIDRLLESPTELPNLGRGYSPLKRAAYKVQSIARRKLDYSLPEHEAVFWRAASDMAAFAQGVSSDEDFARLEEEDRLHNT